MTVLHVVDLDTIVVEHVVLVMVQAKKDINNKHMKTIDKYLTEAKVNTDEQSLKRLILSGKSGIYNIEGEKVSVDLSGDTLIFTYPSSMMDFTYKLAQVTDSLGLDSNQIGLGNKRMVKFLIDLQ